MRRILTPFVLLLALLALAVPLRAQITVPNTFVADTDALAELVNENFNTLGAAALNRAGGNLTGSLTVAAGVTIDGVDISSQLTPSMITAPNLTVTGSATFNGPVTFNGPLTLTLPETSIADGALLARVAAPETISGPWTFTTTPVVQTNLRVTGSYMRPDNAGAALALGNGTNTAFGGWEWRDAGGSISLGGVGSSGISVANNRFFGARNIASVEVGLLGFDASNNLFVGPPDALVGAGCCGHTIVRGGGITFRTNGGGTPVDRTTIDGSTGLLTHAYAVAFSGVINPSALASGNNNDYAPTGIGTAKRVNVTGNAGGSTITGFTGGAQGRELDVCDLGMGGAVSLADNTGSSSANQIDLGAIASFQLRKAGGSGTTGPCVTLVYDTTVNNWLLKGTAAVQ